MIILPFYPVYALLSLMSAEDLLKLILVYSNEQHSRPLSKAEQASQKIVYTAALIALFSKTESEQDILCQTKQLLIGIRQPLLYQSQSKKLISQLEMAILPPSPLPWSHWLHQVKGHQYLAWLDPSNYLDKYKLRTQDTTSDIDTIRQSFATAAKLMQKHFTEWTVPFSIRMRKSYFFWWHSGDFWNTKHHIEQEEVKILAPYFNTKEIERVKTMAIALCQRRDGLSPAKGLYFLLAIFYKLSEKQRIEIQPLVPELLERFNSLFVNVIAPFYELLVLLAPTFYDMDISTIIPYFIKTFSRYFTDGDDFPNYTLRTAPIILIKILLNRMTQEQIELIYTMASDETQIAARFSILSLLIPYLKESQIEACKRSAFAYWASEQNRYDNYDYIMELLIKILPYCTSKEKKTIRTSLPHIPNEKKNHYYLRLNYDLSPSDIEKHRVRLIKYINHFDWDFKPADALIFERLLPTFTEEQITQLIQNMMSAYNVETNKKPYAPDYSMAKERVFRIILTRMKTKQVNFIIMTLMLSRAQFPSAKMQLQALNIMCLFIYSRHEILTPTEMTLCNKTFTSRLLQPFFRFNKSPVNEMPLIGAQRLSTNRELSLTELELHHHFATVLKQLSTYIERIESSKVEYWNKEEIYGDNIRGNINFRHGFWYAAASRAENRLCNYHLALKMRQAIYDKPIGSIELLFNEHAIQTMKNQIKQQDWPINKSLRKIISYAEEPNLSPLASSPVLDNGARYR